MSLSANAIRAQLRLVQPLLRSCTLDTLRRGQNMIGELMEAKFRRQVKVETEQKVAKEQKHRRKKQRLIQKK